MKNGKKLVALILALALILGLNAPALAGDTEDAAVYSAVVRFEDGTDADAACRELEKMPGIAVRWRYGALFQGAAVEGTAAALERIADSAVVQGVFRTRSWARPYAEDGAVTSNSLDIMAAENLAYNGDGMVVAVIDSGLYVSHEAFQDYGIMEHPALSEEDIEAFVADGGTDGRYISLKIPFAYDYSADDRSVHTADTHGTHVAALAVGYAENEDGSVKFRGAASGAQLLCMKVFPDNPELDADDADILKAMDDALLLDADVVNLSLGTEEDFLEGSMISALYQESVAALREAGVIVCCAAGNSGDALFDKKGNVTVPTADYTDYGTACTPAAYPGATAIGAVNSLIRESEGGIVVNGETFGVVKGVSEDENEVLPELSDLAGRELTYVIVDGMGAKSDYDGLDVAGCVAVVARGELYFSEKVTNAAQAGAVACLIYNNESEAITPAVTGAAIPCGMITRTAGEYLIDCAEDGRGTLTVEPGGVMAHTGEKLSMMAASSWGATSDLRLLSTLCAPGGKILSAVTGGTDTYGYLSGTSMAAPNASGAFAALMQALAQRGVSDKKERAELAKSLLQSTASPVTDEDGTPLSPRWQGAGVIDLAAALESRAVIEDPILELGDGLTSTFRLSFTVRNLSEEDLAFSVDARVLTDAFGELDGRFYTTLLPVEITKYMTISGTTDLKVRAGGEQTVRLSLTAEKALIETLEEIYTNGFFLEGYVTLTGKAGESIHATFMGYHGDWEAAPVIEQVDFRALMDALAEGEIESEALPEALDVLFSYNLAFLTGATPGNEQQIMLGQNPWENVFHRDARIAMSTADSDAHAIGGHAFSIDLFTLRRAAHVIMVVSDRNTGKIYYVDDTVNLPRADFHSKTGLAMNMGFFAWDGTDSSGKMLPDGTEVDVEFFAWTESDKAMQTAYAREKSDMTRPDSYRWLIGGRYDNRREWMFPLVLDGTAPVISAEMDEESGEILLTVTEEEFLAHAVVYDSAGYILAEKTFAGESRGESQTLAVTLPEGETEQIVYVTLSDYASNTIGYCLDLSGLAEEGEAEISRCPMAMFTDVKRTAWYHEAVDFVYEEGLMDAVDVMAFKPDRAAMRATVIETLYRLAGEPEVSGVELPFVDVNENEWYIDALEWAYQMGIANGYSADTFAAFAPIPRQQLAAMLYRAAELGGEVTEYDTAILENFGDGGSVSGWAREAMAWAVGEGILAGDSEGNLNPGASATRAELAQIFMNILNESE